MYTEVQMYATAKNYALSITPLIWVIFLNIKLCEAANKFHTLSVLFSE